MSDARARLGGEFGVSRETLERLDTLAALVRRWTPRINLVAKSTVDDIWSRHVLDSAQIYFVAPPPSGLWADFGSGGGFPGLVVAALHPGPVTLVESDRRKATFLRTAAREMGLDVTVIAERIEAVPPLGADTVSARALAPLDTLLSLVHRHLGPGGEARFLKGAGHAGEHAKALETWAFRCETYPSITNDNAAILRLREIEHG